MYKIRIRFTKKEWMIFISHLDLLRLMERALRRARISLSFSQGFNPHPKISFATALALGVSSDGEYMDIEVEEQIDLEWFKKTINEELPQGIEVLGCKYIPIKSEALMAFIEYSTYMIKCPFTQKMKECDIKNIMDQLMNEEEIWMEKTVKKKGREQKKVVNIRPLIEKIELSSHEEDYCILKMLLKAGSKGNIKPEVVIQKLEEIFHMPIDAQKIRIHRLDLYGLENEKLVTPLDITA
ncbi:TIGR03936 family radical SAM-associated protein [Inediibacterium massiliense]|uniref:TIGR03936 family radical SAM-associated protein n=1 Tax=Inediibacterium massiliense TaxID=1658111 RepID=UPI0006B422E2|nr:TIGR03936 family radical SAM-associated protein [Inediibacterium massiliense]